MGSDLLWQYFLRGDLVGFITAVYAANMGEYFFGALFLIMAVPLYVRTNSLTYCMLLWIICIGMFVYFIPIQGQKLIGLFLVLSLGGLLFTVFDRLRR